MGLLLNQWLYDKIKGKKIDTSKIQVIYISNINDFTYLMNQITSAGWYVIEYILGGGWKFLLYVDKTNYPSFYYGASIKISGDAFSPDCCVSNPVTQLECTGQSGWTSYCVEVGRYNGVDGVEIDENVPSYVLSDMVDSLPVSTSVSVNPLLIIGVVGAGLLLLYGAQMFKYKFQSSAARRVGVKYIATSD
jgi:hypothetical protein